VRAALLLSCAALLAGCNGGSAQPTVLTQEAATQKAAAELKGWDRLFGSPETTIAAVNQYGFRATPFDGASTGAPIFMSNSAAKAPNQASFAASGPGKDRIGTLSFTLGLSDAEHAATAKDRFATVIRDFLFSAKAPGAEEIGKAVRAETAAQGTLPGAAYAVAVEPKHQITVTFTRPDTKSAPAAQ
jgi:hypothetical protein